MRFFYKFAKKLTSQSHHCGNDQKQKIMAITKQYLKSKAVCKVTFTVPAEEAKKVQVVGTFNDWNENKALELKKFKNGNFRGTLDLNKDNSYEFRYLVDGTFVNDEQADSYAANGLGTDNCILHV